MTDVMKQFVDEENLPTEHAKLDDNGDGHGSELQESYLPPELGGRAGQSAEPKIGAKDDGSLASKTSIDPPPCCQALSRSGPSRVTREATSQVMTADRCCELLVISAFVFGPAGRLRGDPPKDEKARAEEFLRVRETRGGGLYHSP